jgi:hypothetical protein
MSCLVEGDVRAALREVTKSTISDSWSADFDFLEGAIDSLDHVTLALLSAMMNCLDYAQSLPSLSSQRRRRPHDGTPIGHGRATLKI